MILMMILAVKKMIAYVFVVILFVFFCCCRCVGDFLPAVPAVLLVTIYTLSFIIVSLSFPTVGPLS